MMVLLLYGPTIDPEQPLLGVGIYTVPEAARLTRVRPARIRYWLEDSRTENRHQMPAIDGSLALSFRDLIEVRFVDAFRNHGVGWRVIRLAAERAAELLKDSHPFSTKRFRTDGRRIFAEIVADTGEELLLDLVQSQYGFKQILSPYLYEGLEFSGSDGAIRWFPLAGSRRIVIDPAIAFGQPVVHPEAVPTGILAKAVQVEGSVGRVARWYMVDPQAVRDAVEYEDRLAA